MTQRFVSIVIWTAVAIVLTTKAFFVDRYTMSQDGGMNPAIPPGSNVFVSKRAYANASSVKRGDIVAFEFNDDGTHSTGLYRVIALPGERIEASSDSLVIDGKPVQHRPLNGTDGAGVYQEQNGDASYEILMDPSSGIKPPDISLTVPADHFFVMGDNRFFARDSRYFGAVPFSSIIGKKL